MDSLIFDHAFIAHFDADCVEKHERVSRIKRPLLPKGNVIKDGVRHGADQVWRDLNAVNLLQMADDLAGAHTARVNRDGLPNDPPDHWLLRSHQSPGTGVDIWR